MPFVYPSAGTQQDEELPKPSSPEQPAPGPAALSEDDEEVEEEEPEDEEDEEYTPDGPAPKSPKKRTAQGQQPSRKPAVKRTAVKSMSARYSAGTDVVLPPPRPHPGLAPAQPFDPYIPPSQQQQSYMTHIQSAPNTPLGHRPQYSPVEDYQNHPQTATLPPLQAMPGSASQYYPPLPPMHLSPQRPDMAYYHQMPESPEVAYPREAHYILQNGSHPPPSMVRHHSFSGPYYGNPEQRQQDPRVAAARRMSLPQADALPPPQHTPSLGSYAEQDVDFSPSSSMDSTGMPEAAYSLHHHNSASAGPPSTYLSPQAYAAHSQYMPPAALQDAPHEHPYPSQPRMMYMVD